MLFQFILPTSAPLPLLQEHTGARLLEDKRYKNIYEAR